MLNREQLRSFAADGYLVIPDVVPPDLLSIATREIDALITKDPPPKDHRGQHFYWQRLQDRDPFLRILLDSNAFAIAESLIAPGKLEIPTQAQIALNLPPFSHRPGGPHIDGASPPEPSGRPGTFTMLAGILLSDQSSEDTGNLWVWPGTHLAHEAYFRERGPEALLESKGYPPIELPAPSQILGRAGDLLLSHYMLGHNIGGNTSSIIRRALYFRLVREGHRDRWRDCVRDAMLEFDAVRAELA